MALSLTSVSTAAAAPFAYVSNFSANSVSVVDRATNTVVRTIPVGEQPHGVAVNRTGTRVYVANSNFFGNGVPSVSVIDTVTNTVICPPGASEPCTVTVLGAGIQPSGVAVSADGSRVYVTNGNGTVAVIDGASNALVPPELTLGGMFGGLVVVGSAVYVVDRANVINVLDSTAPPIFQGMNVKGIAASGSRLYVVDANLLDDLELWVIDTATNPATITGPTSVGTMGNESGRGFSGIAVTPRGSLVYVTVEFENTVWVFDGSGNFRATVGPGVPAIFNAPFGVAVDDSGAHVFVVNSGNGSVTVLDGTNDNAFVASVPVGSFPLAFGAFVTGGPQPSDPGPTPTPAPLPCDAKIAELQKKVSGWGYYRHNHGYNKLKTALRMRAEALQKIEKATARVGAADARVVKAKKEFKRGDDALCANRYWRAAHEYWEAYEIAHRVLKRSWHHRR